MIKNVKQRMNRNLCTFCEYKGSNFSIKLHKLKIHFKKTELNNETLFFCETEKHFSELLKLLNTEKGFGNFIFPCWIINTYVEVGKYFNRESYYELLPLNMKTYEDRVTQAEKDLKIIKQTLEN